MSEPRSVTSNVVHAVIAFVSFVVLIFGDGRVTAFLAGTGLMAALWYASDAAEEALKQERRRARGRPR